MARVKAAAIGFVAVISSGCLDYGDQALSFVENDAHRISRELAEADLEGRWLNASKVLLLELSLRDSQWFKDATSLEAPPDLQEIPDSADLLSERLSAVGAATRSMAALKE